MRIGSENPYNAYSIQNSTQIGKTTAESNQVEKNQVNNSQIGNRQVENNQSEDPKIQSEIDQLKVIEDKVIAHEQAHKSVGGEFAGAASYGYTTGPDGRRYVTSGEVSISVPSSGNPEDLVSALERVKMAAMAPAEPSGQDQRVAASAAAKIMSLRTDIAKKRATEAYSANADDPAKAQQSKFDLTI